MRVNDEIKAQELVSALSDVYSRKILGATLNDSKSSDELSREQNIPSSTCYRRIHDLVTQHILRVSKIELENGKTQIYYRSAYKNFTILLESDRLVIDATPNAFERHPALMVTEPAVIVN